MTVLHHSGRTDVGQATATYVQACSTASPSGADAAGRLPVPALRHSQAESWGVTGPAD